MHSESVEINNLMFLIESMERCVAALAHMREPQPGREAPDLYEALTLVKACNSVAALVDQKARELKGVATLKGVTTPFPEIN